MRARAMADDSLFSTQYALQNSFFSLGTTRYGEPGALRAAVAGHGNSVLGVACCHALGAVEPFSPAIARCCATPPGAFSICVRLAPSSIALEVTASFDGKVLSFVCLRVVPQRRIYRWWSGVQMCSLSTEFCRQFALSFNLPREGGAN